MNDPHVAALVYRIEPVFRKKPGDLFDYSKAKPFCRKNQAFRRSIKDEEVRFDLSVKDEEVRLELHDHYPTIEEASEALEEYIRVWQFDAQLKQGPDSFRLVLDCGKSEVIDRNPTPGRMELSVPERGKASDSATTKLTFGEYPAPPSGMALNPDIATMYHRYMGYKSGWVPLPGMAYFCLSMAEDPPSTNMDRRKPPKRKAAAERLKIDVEVLAKVGHLSSAHGGPSCARKHEGVEHPLSDAQSRFLDAAGAGDNPPGRRKSALAAEGSSADLVVGSAAA